MEVFTNLIVVMILQRIHVPNHHTAHLKLTYINASNISEKLKKESSWLQFPSLWEAGVFCPPRRPTSSGHCSSTALFTSLLVDVCPSLILLSPGVSPSPLSPCSSGSGRRGELLTLSLPHSAHTINSLVK